jgi:[acyl-carrier-protein] S-malonyltransferase
MASAQPKLQAELACLTLKSPSISVISNVTAQPHDGPESIRARLVEQVTSPVRWEESVRYLLSEGFTRFIELGPGTALSGFMKRIDKEVRVLNVSDVASLASTAEALSRL